MVKRKAFLVRVTIAVLAGGWLLLSQCIDPFTPEINENDELLVIEGSIIKGAGEQIVTISRSAPVYQPDFNPVSGCLVKVIDEMGREIVFSEKKDGTYSAEIGDDYLQFNLQYKLAVLTPDGKHYESDFETLIESASVDSMYGKVEKGYSTDKEREIDVMQYYIDLKASMENSRYYRWELTETWENRSAYLVDAIDYGDTIIEVQDSFELYYCWSTKEVKGLYSANTLNLERNEKKKIPLNTVDGSSLRLSVKYSLLVRQYALNEGAYTYWNDKRVVLEESGGLYTAQPSQVISNISSMDDPDEVVLGYFWASSVTEKRIFTKRPSEFRVSSLDCSLISIDSVEIFPEIYPMYLVIMEQQIFTADKYCFDCTHFGATNVKPDFWEDY